MDSTSSSVSESPRPDGPIRKALENELNEKVFQSVPQSEGSLKVLIVDRAALRILSSTMDHNSIVDKGFNVIEMLEYKREPLRTMPAVYLLTPSVETVDQLCAESSRHYQSYRVFFTSHVPDYLMNVFKEKCRFLKKIKAFTELNARFLALESRLFSLDRLGASIPQLHSVDFGADKMRIELSEMADHLAEVCSLVAPATDWTIRHDGMSFTARTLGSLVNEELRDKLRTQRMKQREQSGHTLDEELANLGADGKQKQATLLIIDRVSDLVTPLIHDYHYQAMAHDLLPLNYHKPGGVHMEVPDNESKTPDKKKFEKLDGEDEDPMWTSIRSMFIQDALQHVQQAFQIFLENDAAYKIRNKGGQEVGMKEMSAAVRSLPASRKKADKYALHILAARMCLERVSSTNLTELTLLEQDLIVGRAPDGTKLKVDEVIAMLITTLEDEDKFELVDRLRLFFLCLIVIEGMTGLANEASYLATSRTFISKMKRALMERFSQHWVDTYLSDEQRASLKGLQRLLNTAHDGYSRLAWKIDPDGAHHHNTDDQSLTAKLAHRFAQRQETKKRRATLKQRLNRHVHGGGLGDDDANGRTGGASLGDDEDSQKTASDDRAHYDVARYVPPLWGIMMDMIDQTLDNDAFPRTTELSVESILTGNTSPQPETSASSSSGNHGDKSYKSGKFLQNFRRGASSSSSTSSDDASSATSELQHGRSHDENHLFMVFIVGGVSYTEVRAMYDVCAKRNVNIVIGATNILTPHKFLRYLAAVDDPVVRLQVLLPPLPLELAVVRKPQLQNRPIDSFTPSVNAQGGASAPDDEEQEQRAQQMDDEFHQSRKTEEVIVVQPYRKKKGLKKFFGKH